MRYAIFQQQAPVFVGKDEQGTQIHKAVVTKVGELNAPNTDAAIAQARTMPLFLMARRGAKDLSGFPIVEVIR